MKHHLENMIGFFSGLGGFFLNIAILQTGVWWFDIAKAGATALVCGFLGIAGKNTFLYVARKLKRKK